MDQVLAVTVGDTGKRMHRTRHDRHTIGFERAGRDRSAHVALAMNDAGTRAYLLDSVARLVLKRALRPFADDKVAFNRAALERLEHPHAEDGAGGAGHADNEPPHSVSSAMTNDQRASWAFVCEHTHEIHCVARTFLSLFYTVVRVRGVRWRS